VAQWVKPAALAQPTPREVVMDESFKRQNQFFVLTMLPFLLFAAFVAFGPYYKTTRLQNHGISTVGTVSAVHVTLNPKTKGPAWSIEFTFGAEQADGSDHMTVVHESDCPQEFGSLVVGQPIPVIYDPGTPENAEINIGDRVHKEKGWLLLVIMPLPFILTFIIIFSVIGPGYFKQKELLKNGQAVEAVILDEEEVSSGRSRCTVVTFQFTDEQGKRVEGRQKGLPTRAERDAREGFRKYYERIMTNPTVVFDPKDSSRNMLYLTGLCVLVHDREEAIS
jgi:hypothetical protein